MAKGMRCVMAAVALTLAGGGPGFAQQPSTADLQWAQTILKDKGFDIGGRANGQMTPQTRTALSAYQRSAGLPVTGQLDKATVDHMLAGRQSATTPTMGNLAAPRPSGSIRAPERDVAVRAAPTARVEGAGHDGAVVTNPVVRAPGAPSSAAAGPVPLPAPAPAVSVAAGDTAFAALSPVVQAPTAAPGVPGWLRYALMAVIGGTLGAVSFVWWRSGRAGGRRGTDGERPAAAPERREPTFGPRQELTTGPLPPLSAPRRGRG